MAKKKEMKKEHKHKEEKMKKEMMHKDEKKMMKGCK